MSQIKVGIGIEVKEGSDCRLRGKHIQCCYILPVEEDLSLCQAGNSKCLALKVFPTWHLPWKKRQQSARGCGGLESNALDGGRVARVLGGNTGGSRKVATYTCQMGECHMLPSGIHKTHFRELRKPALLKWTDDAKERYKEFYSVETDE